jgi:hypothetical protein
MAERFVRIDLSDGARDFRPIAVEPGVPVLDKSNHHARILFRWLGGFVAEPEWEGDDSVNFYVRDDHAGRLEEVVCQPIAGEDLAGCIKDDVQELDRRIAKAKPENPTERALLKIVRQTFNSLVQDPNRRDQDNYFFRYKDVQERWRLVWCFGYDRNDQTPAAPVICTNSDCNQLFVRRPGQTPKCPGCESGVRPPAKRKRRLTLPRALLLLLLLLLLGYWFWYHNRLVAMPDQWAGPVGSSVDFQVAKTGKWNLFHRDNVTSDAVAVSADPRIMRIAPFGGRAMAVNPGRTQVSFYHGNLSTAATLTVKPGENPKEIWIEPQDEKEIPLGIGTTRHLKLVGKFENGGQADLTDLAEWDAKSDGKILTHDGFVEGMAEGKSSVDVRYRAKPDLEYMAASKPVSVSQVKFKSLRAKLERQPVPLGYGSGMEIDALDEDGTPYSVLESSRLKVKLAPPRLATYFGTYLRGDRPGKGILKATFESSKNLTAELPFEVAPLDGLEHLVVAPERLDMAVGEIADLSVLSPSAKDDEIKISSSDPKIVEIKGNRLVGRGEGVAKVEVAQGSEKGAVNVSVTKQDIVSIAVKPTRVAVPVQQSAAIKVMGQLKDGPMIELAPDALDIQKTPSQEFAELNSDDLVVRGIRPTPKLDSEKIGLALKADPRLHAEAPVGVFGRPESVVAVTNPLVDARGKPTTVRIVCNDSEQTSIRMPVAAQFKDFRVEAVYPPTTTDGAFTRIVTKLATLGTPDESGQAPVTFSRGAIIGVQPGKTAVGAAFDGVMAKESLPTEVTADVDIDEIELKPSPATILPGETRPMEATGRKDHKSVGMINNVTGMAWKSDNEQKVRVSGPAVTGVEIGQAHVTAAHGSVKSEPAAVDVVASIDEALAIDHPYLRLLEGQSAQLGVDFNVAQGQLDISTQCEATSSAPDIVRCESGGRSLFAVRPGIATVMFSRGGRSAAINVEVVAGKMPEGAIVVEPAAATLSAGQAQDLRVFIVTKDGVRVDRTDVAKLTSSDTQKVDVAGGQVRAVAPGSAEITATLPDSSAPGKAHVTVDNEPITELAGDPAQLNLQLGEHRPLRILGRSASGTHEMYPEALKVAAAGEKPDAIKLNSPRDVEAVAKGKAEINVSWQDKVSQKVPVTVADDEWTDLKLDPATATIHPGQKPFYTLSGVRGGERRPIWPQEGMKLSVQNPDVGEVLDHTWVQGKAPGTTKVIGSIGGKTAEADLTVVAGSGAEGVVVDSVNPNGVVVVGPGDERYVVRSDVHGAHDIVTVVPEGGTVRYALPGAEIVGTVDPKLEHISIEPSKVALKKGETTPAFSVVARTADGTRTLDVPLETDSAILAPSSEPGRFEARQLGQTQVRATVGGQQVSADVNVTGDRFAEVKTEPDERDTDFVLKCTIRAPAAEGDLEYRVYVSGQDPPDTWAAATKDGDGQQVSLTTPAIVTGPPSKYYELMFEARDKTGGEPQKYPYRFRLRRIAETSDSK